MATTRCPVVRPQAEPYGSRGFTTDYHDWRGGSTCCFCGVSRAAAKTASETRASRLGWQGLEVDRVRQEYEQIRASQSLPLGLPYSPSPNRWACVMSLLKPEAC